MQICTRLRSGFPRLIFLVCVLIAFCALCAACGDDEGGSSSQISNSSSVSSGGSSVSGVPELIAEIWTDGDLATPDAVQWFRFTAAAATQYIHADFNGTLDASVGVYVRLYTSGGAEAADTGESMLFGDHPNTERWSLTTGQEYYIKVRVYTDAYTSGYSGTYRIAVASSTFRPSEFPPANPTELTAEIWSDGEFVSADEAQWFKFTATAGSATQYIHFKPGDLIDVRVWVYTGTGVLVSGGADEANLHKDGNLNTSRSLAANEVYYVSVRPYNAATKLGSYQMAVSTSSILPGVAFPSSAPPLLTAGTWTSENITAVNRAQWFRFSAAANTHFVHFDPTGLDDVYVRVFSADGTAIGYFANLYDDGPLAVSWAPLTPGNSYYILVYAYSSGGSGAYRIAVTQSSMLPGETRPPDGSIADLTASIWKQGSISAGQGVQWFRFTAMSDSQYIHFKPGDLEDIFMQIFSSDGAAVGREANLDASALKVERAFIGGQVYYIRVWAYSSLAVGSFQMTFGDFSTPP